jgi:hypothetical protein
MRFFSKVLLLVLLLIVFTTPAFALIKVLVKVGDAFYADANALPDPDGVNVCVVIRLDPFGSGAVDIRTKAVCRARATLVAADTLCGALKADIITAAVAEYPSLSLVAGNILVQGCPE